MSQNLIRCDIETLEVVELFSFGKKLNLEQNDKQTFWKVCLYNDLIVFPRLGTNVIYLYDTSTEEVREKKCKIENLDSAYCYDGVIWISTSDGRIYVWNPENDEVDEKRVISNNKASAYIIAWNGTPYLIPNFGREILRYENNQFQSNTKMMINNMELNERGVHFEAFDIWKNKISVYPRDGGNLVIIDSKMAYEKNALINYNDAYKSKYLNALRDKAQKYPIMENGPYSLKDFIEALTV
jgi:hypothetical protein